MFARIRVENERIGDSIEFIRSEGVVCQGDIAVLRGGLGAGVSENIECLGGGKLRSRGIGREADLVQKGCLLYTSPSPRDRQKSRMPSSA